MEAAVPAGVAVGVAFIAIVVVFLFVVKLYKQLKTEKPAAASAPTDETPMQSMPPPKYSAQ